MLGRRRWCFRLRAFDDAFRRREEDGRFPLLTGQPREALTGGGVRRAGVEITPQ